MKHYNYEKFQIRGAIKEIMRNYGLRTISIKNYFDFIGETNETLKNVHSVKYDIMNGYIKIYGYKPNDSKKRYGEAKENVNNATYKAIYNVLESLLKKEQHIPSKIKRNIMVSVNR